MATKPTQTPKPKADGLEERLNALTPEGAAVQETGDNEEHVKYIQQLEKEIESLKAQIVVGTEQLTEAQSKIAELEEDKEALNEQIDELEKIGTSRGESLKVRQASDAVKPSDIELKDNRIYLQGVGLLEKEDITEAHIKALCEHCEKETGAAPQETINKYFKLKAKVS